MPKPKIQISWSGGKDSAIALHKLMQTDEFEITGLHTVFDEATKRVGIHEIPMALINKQAKAIGLPVTPLFLKKKPMAYDKLMVDYYKALKEQGVEYVMFGDIFLEDLKDFRETLMKNAGIKGAYPIWKSKSSEIVSSFLDQGFRSKICAADAKFITSNWVGQDITQEFIQVHDYIDPCGENGEYHSFVYEAPFFKKPITLGEPEIYEKEFEFKVKDENGRSKVLRDTFYFASFEG